MKAKTILGILIPIAIILGVFFILSLDSSSDISINQDSPDEKTPTDKSSLEEDKPKESSKPEENICNPAWSCTNWEECIDEQEIRTCSDAHSCGNLEGKPDESRTCTNSNEEIDACGGCGEWQYCWEGLSCKDMQCKDYEGATSCDLYQYCNGEVIDELTFSSWECCLGSCEYGTASYTNKCEEVCANLGEGYTTGECAIPPNDLCTSADSNAIYSSSENPFCIYTLPGDEIINFPCCCS